MGMESRKRLRLTEISYSEGFTYFLTILCKDRAHILGRIDSPAGFEKDFVRDGVLDVPPAINMELSNIGNIVNEKINEINERSENIVIEKYVIMPNHVHFLVSVSFEYGTSRTPSLTGRSENQVTRQNEAIPKFVSYFKRSTNKSAGTEIWHRSYHDHVIRDVQDYINHCNYIDRNPLRRAEDEYFI